MNFSTSILAGSIAAVAEFAPDYSALAAIRIVNRAAEAAARAAAGQEELIKFNTALYGEKSPDKNTFTPPNKVSQLPFLQFRQGVGTSILAPGQTDSYSPDFQEPSLPDTSPDALDEVVRKYAPSLRSKTTPLKGSRYTPEARQDQATDVDYLPADAVGDVDPSLIGAPGPHEDAGYSPDEPANGLFPWQAGTPDDKSLAPAPKMRTLAEAQDALIEDPMDVSAWRDLTDNLTRKTE